MPARSLAVASLLLLLAAVPPAMASTGFTATISSATEVPTNSSTGTGAGTFVLNDAHTQLIIHITYTGLSANQIAAHLHDGLPGFNGPIKYTLDGSGTTTATWDRVWSSTDAVEPLTSALVADLLAGKMYVNIHSTTYTAGELRGQVVADATPNRVSTWGRIKHLYH